MQETMRTMHTKPIALSQDSSGSWPQPQKRASEGFKAIDKLGQKIGLNRFPNDLTKLLYLASLRDCNSGAYLHPKISARVETEVTEEAFAASHDFYFRRLLLTPMRGYVQQLHEYIDYTRMEKAAVLRTWQSLKAYRATVPMLASALCCDIFCLKVEMALMILDQNDRKGRTQEAASR